MVILCLPSGSALGLPSSACEFAVLVVSSISVWLFCFGVDFISCTLLASPEVLLTCAGWLEICIGFFWCLGFFGFSFYLFIYLFKIHYPSSALVPSFCWNSWCCHFMISITQFISCLQIFSFSLLAKPTPSSEMKCTQGVRRCAQLCR